MASRILVPLDGSPFAEWALPTAVSLAGKTGGTVRLVSVVENPPAFVRQDASGPEYDRMQEYLTSVMNRILLQCPGKIERVVREGWPIEELGAEAAQWRPDIVVMATHGRAGLPRIWRGSVAARLVESARYPVLLIRPPDTGEADPEQAPCIARVVVPLDGSELAERALEHAASLARVFGVHILLISVRQGESGSRVTPEYEPAHLDDPIRAAALTYLKTQVARLRQSGIHSYGMLLNEPNAAETIADRVKGDLVVMATHGHERLRRTLLGTVTDKVVRDATCPVLVIPPLHVEPTKSAKSA